MTHKALRDLEPSPSTHNTTISLAHVVWFALASLWLLGQSQARSCLCIICFPATRISFPGYLGSSLFHFFLVFTEMPPFHWDLFYSLYPTCILSILCPLLFFPLSIYHCLAYSILFLFIFCVNCFPDWKKKAFHSLLHIQKLEWCLNTVGAQLSFVQGMNGWIS